MGLSKTKSKTIIIVLLSILLIGTAYADRRSQIYDLATEVERQSAYLAQSTFEHFKGWSDTISDEEQAVLFKTEAFAASCRLFLRLTEERSNYFKRDYLRTSLYNAFTFLTRSFQGLEKEMRKISIMPYALSECRQLLDRMDNEFSRWPAADNLAYLHQKYVKAQDDTVYMIEREGPGQYIRRAFINLESIYRYNYDLNRGKDPWKHLVEVPYDTLEKMEEGSSIDLSFEGLLVIEQSSRVNRGVFLIEDSQRRGITSPRVLRRFGGWDRVFEVPAEVILKYPEGEPIK